MMPVLVNLAIWAQVGGPRVRGEAQRRIYALDKTGVDEVARWIENVQAFWAPKLDALEAALLEDNCHE